jgi:regulator of protease activity HflC (stomatin/prohibitin superfamily)
MGFTIILSFIALFVVVFSLMGLKIVQQSETMVIERLGKYSRTLPSGINVIWPVIDRPREIMWRYLREIPDGAQHRTENHRQPH